MEPMETKAIVTVKTGWKISFWLAVGQVVAFASQAIPLLQLAPKHAEWIPFIGMILSVIGKMSASYVATE